MADLTVGVLGVLCLWFGNNFWLATAIANAVWLLGDAAATPYARLSGFSRHRIRCEKRIKGLGAHEDADPRYLENSFVGRD
jgi:hypothetical protein